MNDNTNPAMVSLESDMAEIEGMIVNARRALMAGERLDLTPLGARISALCDGIRGMALTAREPEAVQRRLRAMATDLSQLEAVLRAGAQQDGIDLPDADLPDGPLSNTDKDGR